MSICVYVRVLVTAIATCGFGLGLGLRLERPRGFKESSGSGGTEENGHQKEREIECGSPQVTRLTSSRGDARSLSHGSARPANIRRCLSTAIRGRSAAYGQNAERTTREHTPPNQPTTDRITNGPRRPILHASLRVVLHAHGGLSRVLNILHLVQY